MVLELDLGTVKPQLHRALKKVVSRRAGMHDSKLTKSSFASVMALSSLAISATVFSSAFPRGFERLSS